MGFSKNENKIRIRIRIRISYFLFVIDERLIVPIAEKTHTYLDILRERKKVKGSPTIIATTSSTTTTTTSTATTTTTTTGLFTFQIHFSLLDNAPN